MRWFSGPRFDKGKKAKATRMANTLDKEPKDRTKARPSKRKKGFKVRSKK